MRDFKGLKVWQKTYSLTLRIYQATMQFPSDERFGLTNQIRRASASIGTNLAEGCGYDTDAMTKRFAQIAMGSASEVEYQLLLAHDLKYLSTEDYQTLARDIEEIKRMLTGYIQSLKADC
jgi:four helix bundle protein